MHRNVDTAHLGTVTVDRHDRNEGLGVLGLQSIDPDDVCGGEERMGHPLGRHEVGGVLCRFRPVGHQSCTCSRSDHAGQNCCSGVEPGGNGQP